jgi:serine phosphatase RsbU (regulator of sigma subunit)
MGQMKKNERKLAQLVELRTAEINLQKEELLAQRDRIEEQKIQIEKSYHKLNTVSEIGQKVTAVLNYEELTALLYAQVNKLLRADGFGIGLLNSKLNRLDFRGFIENNEVLPFSFDLLSESEKYSVKCFHLQEMIFINDRQAESDKNEHFEPSKHGKEAAALIYLPLKIESETLGVITVQSFEKNVYRDYHLTTFQALASYIAIALANTKAYEIIHEKNRNITDSIRYAMTIQNSILPNNEELCASFEEFFIIYKPKDIVSGDFYWHYSSENLRCFAVVDCTGHGVPGAFMSLIGNMLLNEIVHVLHILQPDKVLEKLNSELKKALKQASESGSDGMDVCFFSVQNKGENSFQIQFAGAKRPIYYTENGNIAEKKGTKKSIGAISSEENVVFQNEIFFLKKGEKLYLSTDGFADQSNPERKKFGSANLRKLLEILCNLPLSEQKEHIETALQKHSGFSAQRDDITLIGLKL